MALSPFADPPEAKRPQLKPLHLRVDPQPVDQSKRVSGASALGMGLMNMDDSDSDSDDEPPARASHRSPPPPEHPQARNGPIPLAAPRPGYAVPALDLQRPERSATLDTRARHAVPDIPPPAYISVPNTPVSTGPPSPLPLGAPMTPIQPVFARPAKVERDVKFAANGSIMRGQAEDVLIPKRGEKGDDFWRRFSMVAHDEAKKKPNEKTSTWLHKTQSGTSRMSRWVWIVGIFFLLVIAAAIGFGWYISHNSTTTSVPKALGGSDGHQALSTDAATTTKGAAAGPASSSLPHVSPTHTVARREPYVLLQPTGVTVPAAHKQHRRRNHVNRSSDLD